jgi:hypothetical protein
MSLSIDSKLNEALQVHGVSVEHFAALAALYHIPKCSKAKIYESFRGGKALANETALAAWKLWLKIADLISRAKPLTLSFSNPEHTKTIIELLDAGVLLLPVETNSITDITTPSPDNSDGEAASNSLPENQNEGNRL